MKLFQCQNCGQALYFENTTCTSCGLRLGYVPEGEIVTALEEADGLWTALAVPESRYRLCANAQHDVCNWLGPDHPENFCAACRHNRTIPDLSNPDNLAHWRKIEFAKHRLFYSLLRLDLPLATRRRIPTVLPSISCRAGQRCRGKCAGPDRTRQRPDHAQRRPTILNANQRKSMGSLAAAVFPRRSRVIGMSW